ncbi:MAG TPA: prepilin-type N-terminal cleavage/methylation domain-containing protein [bacterium]|nr:prepilin-type N-terminal cleavage/methylation domain-containing protein [bacterium]
MTHPLPQYRRRQTGFTLIEVAIILSVIGIITLVSLPVYQQIQPNISLNSETREIVSNLRYAQQLSVTEQKKYGIVFNQGPNNYALKNTETGSIIKNFEIQSQITIADISGFTDNTVIFNVAGAVLESGTITITNLQNEQNIIEIKPSGYVKIK